MGDTTEYKVGPPSDYVGGHIAIGVVTFVEMALPVILYYTWQNDRLKKLTSNDWYVDSWKTMTWGGCITYFLAFLFWTISFAGKSDTSYLYLFMLMLFGGLYGFYITASTIIYQFQAIRGYSSMDSSLAKSEIWGVTGGYMAIQMFAAFLGQHYLWDSVMYLLSSEIKEWCDAHPGICEDTMMFAN